MSLQPLPLPAPIDTTDRLHLLLAAGSALTGALTGTAWGAWMALAVLLLVAARGWVRQRLVSVAAGRGVLAPTQRTGPLDPSGEPGQAVARP